ncbi:MAG: ferredoxin family protein [Bacillota bacterium]
MKRLSAEELLALNKYILDPEDKSIVLNKEICRGCSAKPCTFACPAGLYTVKDGEIGFDHAGCLECGTCRVICLHPAAINWRYPRGGFGISYRYG